MSAGIPPSPERIGHEFQRPELLAPALVHRPNVPRSRPNHEKHAFLRDAVLHLAIP